MNCAAKVCYFTSVSNRSQEIDLPTRVAKSPCFILQAGFRSHTDILRNLHRAEVRDLGAIRGRGFSVILEDSHWIERAVELIAPAEVVEGSLSVAPAREANTEGRAATDCTFHGKRPPHSRDELPADRQP